MADAVFIGGAKCLQECSGHVDRHNLVSVEPGTRCSSPGPQFCTGRARGGYARVHQKPIQGTRVLLCTAVDNYASIHAEMSPMDYKAFLPPGRNVFYYYQYRKDMLERHGCILGHGPSELGNTPRPNNVEPSTPTRKRGRDRPAPHNRNDQDVPSGKKRRGRLNRHCLGEQSVLGGHAPARGHSCLHRCVFS